MADVLKRRDSTIEAIEMLGDEDIVKVREFVDDDLLSCFLWAAGENAIAQAEWKSPFSMPRAPPMESVPSLALPPASTPAVMPAELPVSNSVPSSGIPESTSLVKTKSEAPSLPLTKEDKTAQRMKRKAESARVARLRKKEYVSGLEEQIKATKAEAERLKAAKGDATPGSDKKKTVMDEAEKQLNRMDALLRRQSVEQLTPEVNATVERFVQNKRKRQDLVNEHLDCILELLSPGENLQLAFAPNGDMQSFAASTESKRQKTEGSSSNLLDTVAQELGLTSSQMQQLEQHKSNTRRDREILVSCEVLCNELRQRITEHIQSSQGIMDGLRKILTPVQVAKFLMWVEKNQHTMDTMNSQFNWELEEIDALDFLDEEDDESK